VSRRPLVYLIGLTVGDYLLWNWSLNSNHDVIALASGLTLPPLALMLLGLLAVGIAKLVAHTARRPAARRNGNAAAPTHPAKARGAAAGVAIEEQPAPSASTGASSRKLAA
jgi:hypothetical protein